MPKLENWSVVSGHHRDNEMSPELTEYQRYRYLSGIASGDDLREQSDGKITITSCIVGKKGDKVITIARTHYELGKVADEYEKVFPNAKARLLATLTEGKTNF